MKYKFVFLFTFLMKFCNLIDSNTKKLNEGMMNTLAKIKQENFINMFKSAYLTKFVQKKNEVKDSDESFEKEPSPINKI